MDKPMIIDFEYDFSSDPDFIYVRYNNKQFKALNSSTFSIKEFRENYGRSGYGVVNRGTEFWILESDYDANPHLYEIISTEVPEATPQEFIGVDLEVVDKNVWETEVDG